MANELLRYLLWLALASSAGITAVLLTRRPTRCVFGSSACYSLWLLVPVAMLGALLPHVGSSVSMTWTTESVSAVGHALAPASLATGQSPDIVPSIDWEALALGAWCTGAAFFAAYLALQQRAFVKSLGRLSGSRCVFRTACPGGCPVLLGVLWPKIILPADFESRYTRLERLLIFSHERTHLRRGDAACNGFVALMRCIFWFNPLAHLASSYFRVDQEFACDAAVLRDYPASRRAYASAMLKTELADLALPVGCHWHSVQGLMERIRILKQRMPSRGHRVCGGALTALLSLVVGCTTWVAQPAVNSPHSQTAIMPAQSPGIGPAGVTFTARAAHVTHDQGLVLREGRLVLPSGAKVQLSADSLWAPSPKSQTLQGHVRMTISSPIDWKGEILEGHVHIGIVSPADGEARGRAMMLETDTAVVTRQPDGSSVVRFEEAQLRQLSTAEILTQPLSLTTPETPHLVTPNFQDADLAQVAKAVGLATYRTFMIDPRVHARVTLLSSAPMTPEAFYQAFLGILQAHGLAALPTVASNVGVLAPGGGGVPLVTAEDLIWIVPTNPR